MRTKIFVPLAALALALISGHAMAQVKVGFVNLSRILREAPVAQRAEKKLEQEFSKRSQDLQKTSDQLKKMQENLEKNAVTLSDSERQKKEREFADLNRDFQRRQREFQEDLSQRRNEELSGVMQRLEKVVIQIATTEKFDILVRDGQVIWSSPTIDITDKVIKALDESSAPQ